MQGIFRKENTDKALKYGIYRHLPTYEKIIRNLVSFLSKIPYRNLLYIIPICLLLFGAIFSGMLHIMYPIFLIEWKEVSKKDIKK